MQQRIKELEKQVEELTCQVRELIAALETAEAENAFLRKQLYGPKRDRPCEEVQFLLGELFAPPENVLSGEEKTDDEGEEEGEDDEESAIPPGSSATKKKKKPRKKGEAKRLPLINTGLEERVEIIAPKDPSSVIDPCTGKPYPILRYEETRRLAEEPARMFVYVIKRPVYIKKLEETDETQLITTPVPEDNPIERCKADVSLLCSVLIYKYMWHLSLYRIQEIYQATSRLWLARSTLCGWVTGCATALEPIVRLMRERMMQQKLIGLDDTSVCQLSPGEGQVAGAKLWAYTCILKEAPYVVYDYASSREARHPMAFIDASFQGYIQGDAYSGHDGIMNRPGVKGAGCWDHARRYFTDASPNDPKLCAQALGWIRGLYAVERLAKAQGMNAAQIVMLRHSESKPILDELKQWADQTRTDPFLKDATRKALNYLVNQWERLTRYLEDGDIPISNIHTERAMRGVGVGRKNWLFAGSTRGGKNLAIILSIVTTCRNNGIDVRRYLMDVLRRVNTHPNSRLEELLPDRWATLQEAQGESIRVSSRKEWRKESEFLAA